ncbi:MAG: hypothetical protein IT445_17325 [Phycisphaeraceae bacterium]|nr:hypothetical protein [Phycisphaeraceae bacterium]
MIASFHRMWMVLPCAAAFVLTTQAFAGTDTATGLTTQTSSGFGYKYEMDFSPLNPTQVDLDSNSLPDFIGKAPTVFNTGVVGATDGNTATWDQSRPGSDEKMTGQGGSDTWTTAGLDSTTGFTIEVRMHILSLDTDGTALGIHIGGSIGDGADGWLNIQGSGQTWALDSSVALNGSDDNTDDFHTFRMAYQQNNFWVWRDDVLLNPGGTPLADGYATGMVNRNFFGSPGTNWGGIVEADYFRFTSGAFAPLHAGDANGDGLVNLSDLQILGDNWQSTTATWTEADFTGDGVVNLSDLQILGDNWGFGTGPDIALDEALALTGIVIPEPGVAGLLLVGGLLAVRRRA